MNERTAIAVIERDYGSLEDFVIGLISDKREALNDNLPLPKRAELAGLPLPVFARVISSPQFRALLRIDLVNTAFSIDSELRHIQKVASVATGEPRLTMSPSGKIAHVDQAPADLIAAGKYLNELRGTPIEKATQSAHSIIINIGKAEDNDATSITIDAEAIPYQPQRAGGLPPSGIRTGIATPKLSGSAPQPTMDKELGHLYGAGAEEADEDHALAEKRKLTQAEDGGQDERTESDGPIRDGKRRIWSRAWPSRGQVPERAYPRVTVDD